MGGTRERYFDGTSSKPRKLLDCPMGARTPSPRAAVPPRQPRRSLPGYMLCWAATLNHTSLSERQLPIFVALLCIFASRTGYPIHARNVMLPKHQTQLRSVFLNMSHTVQLKLQETRFHPLEDAPLLRSLVC